MLQEDTLKLLSELGPIILCCVMFPNALEINQTELVWGIVSYVKVDIICWVIQLQCNVDVFFFAIQLSPHRVGVGG